MEAALQHVLHTSMGDYVSGLENTQGGFPLVLNNLRLKEKKIQEEMDESGDCPFDFTGGTIGQVVISPGWMGSVEITASNISLNMSFNAMKAMRAAVRPADEPDQFYETMVDRGVPPGVGMSPPRQPVAPPPPVAPRFCHNHDSSDKRVKGEPTFRECKSCGVRLQTSYTEFTLCPPCSEHQRRCMICGDRAEKGSSYIPPTTLNQNTCVPARGTDGPPPEPRRPGYGSGHHGGGMSTPGPPKHLPPHLRDIEDERNRRGGHNPTEDPGWGMGGVAPSRGLPPPPPGSNYDRPGGNMPPSPGSMYGAGMPPGPGGGLYGQGPPGGGCGGPPPPPPGGFNNGGCGGGGPGGVMPPGYGPNGYGPPPGYGGAAPPQNLGGGGGGGGFDDFASAFKGIFDFNGWTQSCNVKSRAGPNQRIAAGGSPGMAY